MGLLPTPAQVLSADLINSLMVFKKVLFSELSDTFSWMHILSCTAGSRYKSLQLSHLTLATPDNLSVHLPIFFMGSPQLGVLLSSSQGGRL